MNLNIVFAKSMNLNVLIKHSMNLIFSNQNLHCESSDLHTGQKDSGSNQKQPIAQNLFVHFFAFIASFFRLFTYFL